MVLKALFSAAATIVTIVAFFPYIHAILRGSVRPHVFSWVIWASTTLIVFFAQWQAKGGVGALPIGISGCITLFVALLALNKRADVQIRRGDLVFFMLACSSLPLWFITNNPLSAVVVLTAVDLMGFAPTFNKAYHAPRSESISFYALFALRNILVLFALEHYSITTLLFPAAISIACILLIGVIVYRRHTLKQSGDRSND